MCLLVVIAMAGLLIDGGLAWTNRRQAQAAADTAALAAAKGIVAGSDGRTEARAVALSNGFGTVGSTDCAGAALPNDGVTVNHPPVAGDAAHRTTSYVEVVTTRKMSTTFAGAIGQSCWMVSARAVSTVGTSSVATCSFCAINKTNKNHAILHKNGSTLRVDGDIYVNSTDGGTLPTDCDNLDKNGKFTGDELKDFKVCGDALDAHGTGGSISARTISVAGGWETHDKNSVKADQLALLSDGSPCTAHPDPPKQVAPYLPSNVCIHMQQLSDPLYDDKAPKNKIEPPPNVGPPVAGEDGCPTTALIPTGTSGSPVKLTISTAGAVICPGTYDGGIAVINSGSVTMQPGIYYLAGGGFQVSNSGAVNGSAGVMIYNASGSAGSSDTNPGVDLVPAPDKSKTYIKNSKLKFIPDKDIEVGESVQLILEVESEDPPAPTGVITFFDGSDAIPGCENMPVVVMSDHKVKATCVFQWATAGTKSASAVYYGDPVYNADGDAKTVTVSVNAGGPITVDTTGSVRLYGATAGTYKGLTIFQQRTSSATITLRPGPNSAGVCLPAPPAVPNWRTLDVPDNPAIDPPPPCGALGGIRGTIYSAHNEGLVLIESSGLAELQVIAGKIWITSDADTRFSYTPSHFANGVIHLVE
jgi:hypothetical protein